MLTLMSTLPLSPRILLSIAVVASILVVPLTNLLPPQELTPDIPTLIRRLGDDDPQIRDAAAKSLTDRPEAIPALQASLKSSDPEVARLAKKILEDTQQLQHDRKTAQIKSYSRNKQYDLLVDAIVTVPDEHVPDEWWQLFVDVGWDLIKTDRDIYKRTGLAARAEQYGYWHTFSLFAEKKQFKAYPPGRPTLEVPLSDIIRESITASFRAEAINVASRVRHGASWSGVGAASCEASVGRISSTFLACGGSVLLGDARASVIICTDNCTINFSIGNAIVVSRKNVRVLQSVNHCLILAGGDVDIPNGPSNSTIRATGNISVSEKRGIVNSELIPNDPRALEGFRFFELMDLGVTATLQEQKAIVGPLAKDSPLRQAGIREKDAILSVGTREIKSLEDLRQSLRRGVVTGSALLKIQRDGQSREITVLFPAPK